MGDYTPVHKPGHALTFVASAALTGRQQVEITGDGEVGPAAAGSVKVVGQAAHDAAPGVRVTVHAPGRPVHLGTASGAITAGDQLVAAANGSVAAGATPAPGAYLGLALSDAADGATVRYQAV